MKRLLARLGTVLMVSLATASHVRADYMNWTYTSSPNVAGVSVGATSAGGGASVTLTDFNAPQAGASSIPIIAYVTSTASATPITFGSSVNTPSTYTLALQITDTIHHDSGTLNFTGTLAGPLSATTSGVINTLTPIGSNSLILDGNKYTVTIPSATLAAPTSPQQNLMAMVSVSNATGTTGGQTSGTPEPASLLLGSLGFSFFGVGCWWKRRSALRRRTSQG